MGVSHHRGNHFLDDEESSILVKNILVNIPFHC